MKFNNNIATIITGASPSGDLNVCEEVFMEAFKFRIPDGETIKNIVFWVLPVLIFLVSGMTGQGMMFVPANFSYLFVKALCGLTVSAAIAVIRSKRSTGTKFAGIFGCIVLFMIFSFMRVLSPRVMHTCTTDNARELFLAKASVWYSAPFSLPGETGSDKPAEYHTFTYDLYLSKSHSCTLLCHYDEAGYNAAVANLDNSNAFVRNMNASDGNDRFRVIRTGYEDESGWNERSMMIVMTNNTDHEIAYIILFNPLEKTLTLSEIVDRYCGWRYIRK